jgi:hypothetical protein
MTARLTIIIAPEVLKALRGSKAIRVAAGANGTSGPRVATKAGAGGFRKGTLPARLVAWATGRKTFGVPQLMKKLRIKRGHASMLVAYVLKAGAVRRVGRGEYRAA